MMIDDEIKETMRRFRDYVKSQPHGTQKELAKRLGIYEQRISEYVRSERRPSAINYLKIKAFVSRLGRRAL